MSDDVNNSATSSNVHFDDTPFEDVFDIETELGSGQFAVVRRVKDRKTGERYAAKFIKKRRYATSRRGVTRQNIEREVRVLQKIRGHSNVVELHAVYETASDVIIVLELVSGGELFDHVCAKECLDEVEAAAFIKQILLAVRHLHSLHVVHLDIKPENVMLKQRGESHIKIIDFGLSREIEPGATVKDMVGTPEFVAPEVVNYEPLSPATDMWAVGVVTYILLSGGSPFLGDNRDETFSNITRVRYHFSDRYFKNTSKHAKDFISRLFVRDVDQRATVEECLQHPWIRGPEGNAIDIRKASCITISHIQSFKTRQRWKRCVELVMVLLKASKTSRRIGDGRFDPEDLVASCTLICAEEGNLRALHKLSALHKLLPNAVRRSKSNANSSSEPIGTTAMHCAAKYGHAEVFNYLHMKGGNICARDDNWDTPLHVACRFAQHTVAGYVANEKVDVDSTNKKGETALHCAVESADTRVVRLLLSLRPRLDLPNSVGDTVLHLAADSINPRIVPLLVCLSPPLHLRNIIFLGLHPLLMYREMSARESSRSQNPTETALKEFVESNGLPEKDNRFPSDSEEEDDSEEEEKETEKSCTREFKKLSVVQSSSNTQTDPSSFDNDDNYEDDEDDDEYQSDTDNTIVVMPGSVLSSYLSDPLTNPSASYLFESPRPRAADFVYPGQDRYSRLGSVPAYSSTTAFIQLLNDISEQHPDLCECAREETPLHVAAARGHVDCVQSLLDANSPLDAVEQDGKTALIIALENGSVDIASILITNGCDINHADNHGDTALHVAAKHGLLQAVQTLCHCAVHVDAVNANQKTALHLAAHYGHVDIIRILLLARADVTLRGDDGLTAELVAVAAERLEAHSLLKMVKSQETREEYISQLYPLDSSLRRIKLKLLGHSLSGKTRLVQTLHSSRGISSFLESVSRRISDHYSPSNSMKDDGIHSANGSFVNESNNNSSFELSNSISNKYAPPHSQYTRGIDVQTVNINGCGEFSVWEFGGYEPMHTCYDHFVGNSDCIHLILYRADDATEDQYKQILYWMNFLKGRVTPFEPIGHCGFSSRRSKVIIVGTHATSTLFPQKNQDGEYISSDIEAMLNTVRLRFETHFDMDHRLILLDATNPSCIGMKTLKMELAKSRTNILAKLLKPLAILDTVVSHLNLVRKKHGNFPVITWPDFIQLVRNEINPLTGDAHCRQIVQQLQLIGELVYLRNDISDSDYVVLNPEWFGTHILGQLLSAEFLSKASPNGSYHTSSLAKIFPEIPEQSELMAILEVLQLCAPDARTGAHEFPVFIQTEAPASIWRPDPLKEKEEDTVYGGVRILPMRGMERSLHSTFPRIQVALRRSINVYQTAKDTQLYQWSECSKLVSQDREAVIRMVGDAVEIRARGSSKTATPMFYFMEDLITLVEQSAVEVGPGISLERHFISPKHLKEHRENPALFPPEAMMEMQQRESLSVKGTQDEEELFTDVVCFGSCDVARHLTLGIDVGVADLQMASRCELACLLDPPHAMGRDWSILAVKLQLTDQVPDVDSTGQSLSRTDQLLNEWAIHHPEQASVGNLCRILVELGRCDARDALYRTVPLYVFAPLEEQFFLETNDSGVVSSCHSSSEHNPINI
ncbi:hypothetical protein GCK72_002006 [Caenorhabditis remanei]|uniref:Uncharacterized protein n=1 Tax=Caenorhabditis remanei TaxID=31234 RepID=A0A6A5HQK9_CAERE|nr:hypothetical protein GCK72_002006 [Caenorhabditis remanei]KAF1770188.1 hypothetical protein GCK72_002006 [Caenorhabditis remanei]